MNGKMRVLVAALAVATAASADVNWQVLPMYGGGYMQNVIICPSNPKVWYTFADVGGPYRSDDAGGRWRALHGNLCPADRAVCADQMRSMSVDPRDENNFVLVGGAYFDNPAGIYVTRDGGQSFRKRATARFYGNGFSKYGGNLVDRDPFDPDRLVAAGDWDGAFLSEDNGETWRKVGLARIFCSDIRFDRKVRGRIYACGIPPDGSSDRTYETGLYRSDDGGATWTKLRDDAPLEICQFRGRTELVAYYHESGDVLLSRDGGTTWAAYDQGLTKRAKKGHTAAGNYLAFGTGSDFVLIGDGSGAIYRRGYDEASWTAVPHDSTLPGNRTTEPRMTWTTNGRFDALMTLVVDPANDSHWLATDFYEIWESWDAGRNWKTRIQGIMQLVSHTIEFDPFSASNIVYGVADMGLFWSADGGRTFKHPGLSSPSRGWVYACTAAYSHKTPGRVMICGGKGNGIVLRSPAHGRYWQDPALRGLPKLDGTNPGVRAYSIAANYVREEFLICLSGPVGQGKGGVYRTLNGGDDWEWAGDGLPTGVDLFRHAEWSGGGVYSQIFFSADGSAVCHSSKTRQSWCLPAGSNVWQEVEGCPGIVCADNFRPGRMLGGGWPIRETLDGGLTWHKLKTNLGNCSYVYLDQHIRDLVIAGTPERVVHVSYDGGTTFQPVKGSDRVPSGGSSKVVVDRGRMYYLTTGSGVWHGNLPSGEERQHKSAALPVAGVLDLGLGVGTNEFGCMSDPAVFERGLAGKCRVVRMTGEDLCDPKKFNREGLDLLIVPTGSAFPSAAADALVSFLSHGGQLLTCGGYAFDQPIVKVDGKWVAQRRFAAHIPKGTVPVELAKAAQWSSYGDGDIKAVVADVKGPAGASGVRVSTPRLSLWTGASGAISLKGWSVLSFLARGDAQTKVAWLEIDERDGSRWRVKLDLTTDWKEFHLAPSSFGYWPDNPSVGRGGREDCLNFDAAKTVSLGLTVDGLKTGLPQGVELCGLKAGVDPQAALRRVKPPLINTRTGRINDGIFPKDTQIQLFDCCEELLHVARTASSAEMRGIVPELAWSGSMKGLSTRAQLGLQGVGHGPNRCAWRPILDCQASDGTLRGHAGAFVHNFSGTFAGSSWAFFGVSDRDLFAANGDGARLLLPRVVDTLLERLSLCETTGGYSCYRTGETARLKTRVANWGTTARDVTVRIRLTDEGGKEIAMWTKKVSAAAKGLTDVEVDWVVPKGAPDYLDLVAELESDRLLDRESGAIVVWTPDVIAKGPKVRREGLRLTVDGESRFFGGAQTFWGQHGSVTARSPRRFHEDFRQMRAYGLRWTRCFLECLSEAEFRDADAIVQLAQKFGIVLYLTPRLAVTASQSELDKEIARMKAICARYADVPGFAIDICNEPYLHKDSLTYREATEVQRRWARELAAAARATRPGVLLSIGWRQDWDSDKSTRDPQIASLDLDFTDKHYYGAFELFVEYVKDIDLRVLGKPFLVGECGSKNHPSYQLEDPWGMKDDDAMYDARFRYLYSHAFGCGATALLSWHWRDPMEGQFPCGLMMPSGVPRPAAAVVKKLAATFGRLEMVDNPPDVVVLMDEEMRYGTTRKKAIEAAWKADEELLWWGANWSKLPSSMAGSIPKDVRLVIRPEALAVETLREEVGRMLREKGAFFTRRAEDSATLETFRVPGKGATGWVFWNGGESAVTAERGGYSVRVGPNRVGYLQIAADGKLEVKEEL